VILFEESLSTNQQIGLALMTFLFVVFALVSSFLIPHFRAKFPDSKRGVVIFGLVSFAFFAGQMLAVIYI